RRRNQLDDAMKYESRQQRGAGRLRKALAIGAMLGIAGFPIAADAQVATFDPGPSIPVPFAVGEKAEYQVKLGSISVGSGILEVVGMERVNGYSTYRTRLHVRGGIPLARVDTRLESWIDAQGLFSRRF